MNYIDWEDKYSVGIPSIDREHMQLVKIINQFHKVVVEKQGNSTLYDVLNNLINYTSRHFETEERYFKETNYPLSANHIREHQALVGKVLDMKKRVEEGKLVLTIEVMKFLKEWLINHIMKSDMEYSIHLKSKGIC